MTLLKNGTILEFSTTGFISKEFEISSSDIGKFMVLLPDLTLLADSTGEHFYEYQGAASATRFRAFYDTDMGVFSSNLGGPDYSYSTALNSLAYFEHAPNIVFKIPSGHPPRW
jgi:hypothetical protein